VPRAYAFRKVTIKVDLDPLHYLISLGCKPAALDHANVYRRWQLPAIFGQLWQNFEAQHGATGGARQYIRVLQCLAEHTVPQSNAPSTWAGSADHYAVDAILQRLRREADKATSPPMSNDLSECQPHVTRVQVPW